MLELEEKCRNFESNNKQLKEEIKGNLKKEKLYKDAIEKLKNEKKNLTKNNLGLKDQIKDLKN